MTKLYSISSFLPGSRGSADRGVYIPQGANERHHLLNIDAKERALLRVRVIYSPKAHGKLFPSKIHIHSTIINKKRKTERAIASSLLSLASLNRSSSSLPVPCSPSLVPQRATPQPQPGRREAPLGGVRPGRSSECWRRGSKTRTRVKEAAQPKIIAKRLSR